MNTNLSIAIGIIWAFLGYSCSPDLPKDVSLAYEQLPEELDFNIHVKPILSDKCFSCHGPDQAKREANLRLDMIEDAYAELDEKPGHFIIKPGNLEKSEVYHRILSEEEDYLMPVPEYNLTLTAEEKAILIKWIEGGAEYKPHWAFLKPEYRDPPAVKNEGWIKNPIDNFILKSLEKEDLNPSPEASKELLLRRLSFDLTGLPPNESDMKAFLEDDTPDAYEKQVDRLLASVHYGEKMAIDWMDLARYSDTHGYTVDYYRDVSPWRDWVIQSFNQNMKYDQFIHWQLAGDLMPNPGKEQILATTFNRLHPQNLEDGIVDEEFRVEYVVDRTSVLGSGFMALTLACARCHDHKYDPISQKNFYELYSFFNNVNEAGLIPRESSTPVPTMMLPEPEQEAILQSLEKLMQDKSERFVSMKKKETEAANAWIDDFGYKKMKKGMPRRGLVAHYPLDQSLRNKQNPSELAFMNRRFSKNEQPNFNKGYRRQGLLMDGEAALDLHKVGIFQRKDPFSVGLWVHIPDSLAEGVIFHKGMGTGLHGYRGYHVYLKDHKLEVMFSHTWPDNAIAKRTLKKVPKNAWIHLMLTYDGSSTAKGIKMYLDGQEMETETEIDNLYKDIVFFDYEDVIYPEPLEPGIKVGARWRGVGIKEALIDDILVYDAELSGLEVLAIADHNAFDAIRTTSPNELEEYQKNLLSEYYLFTSSIPFKESFIALQKARTVLFDSLEQVKEIMVMKEMDKPRQAFVLERGLYDSYGEKVFPNVPESLLDWPAEFPKNRWGLAQWLTHPDHPLTARVAVNRYWQNYFGQGIVKTTEDFGNQGALPSHPELLDWLALEFIRSDWDVKALQKLIVMSASYRQSSITSRELLERDPENVWLARGPMLRLTSEMMRDNALAVSGLLNRKVGGESVRSYQPPGLWKMNSNTYVQDSGDKLYRRSLYTLWKRTVPNPTLSTFDQPDRSECTVRRQKTNTPLQALVLLNDPTYLEASKVLGESMSRDGGSKESISKAYRKITGREASEEEIRLLKELQDSQYQRFLHDHEKAKGWLEAGEYSIAPALDVNLVAANAVVASVILNSDASITKR